MKTLMKRQQTIGGIALGATAVLASMVVIGGFTAPKPAKALPIFTRRYGVPCTTCHVSPPKLNKTGLAFQANHFNWPNGKPPQIHDGTSAVPISALISNNRFSGQGTETVTAFQTAELFSADGFKVAPNKNGGYWLDYFAATNDNDRASDLDGAWVSVPVAGNRGQFDLTAGQFSPLGYQVDQVSSLFSAQPAAMDYGFDNLVFDESQPGVRLEYDDNRHKMSANGDFVDVGIPYNGHLTFNKDSQLDGPQGVYVHAFKRVGFTTAGVFVYHHDNYNFDSAIGTRKIGNVYLLGEAADGHDINGEQRILSGQADYVPLPWLSFSAQYNSITGSNSAAYPVFSMSLYPGKMYWLRLQAETVQQPGARTQTLGLYLQL